MPSRTIGLRRVGLAALAGAALVAGAVLPSALADTPDPTPDIAHGRRGHFTWHLYTDRTGTGDKAQRCVQLLWLPDGPGAGAPPVKVLPAPGDPVPAPPAPAPPVGGPPPPVPPKDAPFPPKDAPFPPAPPVGAPVPPKDALVPPIPPIPPKDAPVLLPGGPVPPAPPVGDPAPGPVPPPDAPVPPAPPAPGDPVPAPPVPGKDAPAPPVDGIPVVPPEPVGLGACGPEAAPVIAATDRTPDDATRSVYGRIAVPGATAARVEVGLAGKPAVAATVADGGKLGPGRYFAAFVPAGAKVTCVTAFDANGRQIARAEHVGPATWPLPPPPTPAAAAKQAVR